ncbi:MAG: hypothetical protein AAF558_06670, partial [Verrucomicrobiota bacterium]
DNSLLNLQTPPDWVMVSRGGVRTYTSADLGTASDKSSGNQDYVLGRFAYMIYEVGGLLDVNVAGHPSGAIVGAPTESEKHRKGALSYADLTLIPGMTQTVVDLFTQWRDVSSLASFGFDTATANRRASGFLEVPTGDNLLVGRQDLIQYFQQQGINLRSLPLLSTFSRAKNVPYHAPDPDRPTVGDSGAANDQSSVRGNYNDDLYNPNLANLRWPIDATVGGVSVRAGEPFLLRRFDLDRVSILSNPNAKSSGSLEAALALQYFGLTWNSTSNAWEYDHGDSSKILTLPELIQRIASGSITPREPDFFELLKAGIQLGSLGRDGGLNSGQSHPSDTTAMNGTVFVRDQDPHHHVLAIGANVIDQYDGDSFPTEIRHSFDPGGAYSAVYGIENLPYISQVIRYARARDADTIGAWWVIDVWNPHRNDAASDLLAGPSQFRVLPEGRSTFQIVERDSADVPRSNPTNPLLPTISLSSDGTNFLQFSVNSSHTFRSPTTLDHTNVTAFAPTENGAGIENKVRGFYVTEVDSAYSPRKVQALRLNPEDGVGMSFILQYNHPTYGWKTYHEIKEIQRARTTAIVEGGLPKDFTDPLLATYNFEKLTQTARADPRTDRFGGLMYDGQFGVSGNQFTARPFADNTTLSGNRVLNGYLTCFGSAAQYDSASGFSKGSSNDTWAPGGVVENESSTSSSDNRAFYRDPDGVIRPGDASRLVIGQSEGQILLPNNNDSRPIILDRAFRSVAEMGYTFRDLPGKSLDFGNEESGDLALLDLFTLGNEASITAGVLNINSAPREVLLAAVSGILLDEEASTLSSELLTSGELDNLGDEIQDLKDSGEWVFRNRGDVFKVLGASEALDRIYTSTDDQRIDSRREGLARALADISDTRTWNVMIDVIVQSGKYSQAATDLAQFNVEGQKRFWVHVAIDRLTGEILEQQWETIYE